MSDAQIKATIKKFTTVLRQKRYSFCNVYLFGSYAKGKAKKDSDIDVAVIVSRPGSGQKYLNKKIKLWELSSLADSRIEPVLIAEKDLIEGATTIAAEVKNNGVLIDID